MTPNGLYIVIEGPDGTGKTTQAQKVAEFLKGHYVHEPGQTAIGDQLEIIIKNRELTRSPLTDLLLFTANRVEVFQQVIAPALKNHEVIVADRNWLSSIAYQGIASGLGVETVRAVTSMHLPPEYIEPTFTILLHTSAQHREKLLSARGTSEKDYFETQPNDFQQALQKGYQEAQQYANSKKSASVSAEGTIEEVFERIIATLGDAGIIER